jgi:hypothetical protein
MGVFVTPQSEIDAYYASPALGQSKAKKLLKGLDAFVAEDENIDGKHHIVLGKGVDILLTGNDEEFNQTYYVSQVEKMPSDNIKEFIDIVFAQVKNNYLLSLPVSDAQIQDQGEHLVASNDTLEEIPSFIEYA